MANEVIRGTGEGSAEWSLPLFQGLDANGNSLWQFDKSGNLTITGALSYGSVANTGAAINYASDLAVNTDKFTVAASSGNTVVGGTLGVTGAVSATSTVHAGGNLDTDGTLVVDGASTLTGAVGVTGVLTLADDLIGGASSDIAINTNKFTVAASSGNTLIAGTLAVTGATTLTGALAGGSSSNIAINTNKFTVAASSGNTLIAGTAAVTGASTLTGAVSCGSTLSVTGTTTAAAIDASGAVGVDGNFDVANTKFTVAAASGNTAILGDVAVNTNKFTVAASSGNTLVAGTLAVTGDVAVATNKFTVAAATGNTLAAGTLTSTGALVASASASVGTNLLASLETGLTAHAGGTQAAALALTATKIIHNVTVVGTDADSVKLPAATGSGSIHIIKNSDAAQSLQLYGASTETIDGVASATGIAVAAGKAVIVLDIAAGAWVSLLGA